MTSGIQFHRYCEQLLSSGAYPCISLHAANAEVNDAIYGAHVFNDAVQGIQQYIADGGQEKLFVSLTLDPTKEGEQLELPAFLASLGVKYLSLNLKIDYEDGREVHVFPPHKLRPLILKIARRCAYRDIVCRVSNEAGQAIPCAPPRLRGLQIKPFSIVKRFDQATGSWAEGDQLFLSEDQLPKLSLTATRFPL